ncbi:MAG: chromosome partitioning protein ParB [Candidatus Binatia bacterium]
MPKSAAARGPDPSEAALEFDDESIAPHVERVRSAGGSVIGAYRDPLSGSPLVLALLPVKSIEPTPFQRDLSPTHAKRLAEKIDESGAFLDPVIAVYGPGETFWTPNGGHRLAAARALGMRSIATLLSPNDELAFRILALNTEKAHNLRDRSLEVIRMARAIGERTPKARESDHAAEFEAAHFLTLGLVYEKQSRFAGAAYQPLLRKVDRFDPTGSLSASLRAREGWSARLTDIDARVSKIIEALKQRGFRSPYLRTFVVARINPVRWIKLEKKDSRPPMTVGEALTRMAKSARDFDVGKVKESELAMVAAVAAEPD